MESHLLCRLDKECVQRLEVTSRPVGMHPRGSSAMLSAVLRKLRCTPSNSRLPRLAVSG